MPRLAQIQVRRDTAANWASVNPVLSAGEIGLETDTLKIKAGDGTTAWASLAYVGSGEAQNSLRLDGRKLFVSASEPATGMVAGDIWIKL